MAPIVSSFLSVVGCGLDARDFGSYAIWNADLEELQLGTLGVFGPGFAWLEMLGGGGG